MNRYQLVVRDKDNNKKVIIPLPTYYISKEGKLIYNKTNRVKSKTLSHIDSLTQKYNDEKHLIEELNNGYYINSKNVDIYISYQVNNEENYVEVLYKKDSPFYQLTRNYDTFGSKINTLNEEFNKMIDVWFDLFKDEDFRNYLIRNKGLNNHFKDNLINCYKKAADVNKKYYYERIKEEFETYKNLRDLYELFKEYNDENYKKEVEEKRKSRKDLDLKKLYKESEMEEDIEGGIISEPNEGSTIESITPLDTDIAWKEYYDLDDVDNMTDEEKASLGINSEEHNMYKIKNIK